MSNTENLHRQNIWFLQTNLHQKAKEHVAVLLEENCSFEGILNSLASTFSQCRDIRDKHEVYSKTTRFCDRSLNSMQILTRTDIEHLRGKPLSLEAPLALEYRGNPKMLSKSTIGIVGSRHPTFYGRLQAQKFARELSKLGYCVISGGAIGVDAIANLYALEAENGASISIIGNGIANPYPASNQRLFQKLSRVPNGLLLSEFASNDTAQKWYFPQRNATIAELSDFLLVIEATLTSGSLMTARFAKECGKDVGALPGSVDNPNTMGSHMLIQNGAFCIQHPDDVAKLMK